MSYLDDQDLRYRNRSPIIVHCDDCSGQYECLYKSAEKNRKKHGRHRCHKCVGVTLKPQNLLSYWTQEKKLQQGELIRLSEQYKKSLEFRNTVNGMAGKKHSQETKRKMSESRKGKIGSKATAWKGGKCSVTKRVKGIIHGRHNWYAKVFRRDGWQCVNCGSKTKIDAHHIDPVNKIIKRLCENRQFLDDDEKVSWLVEQPELIDEELKNGKTLCRECHKKEHKNWGSHECR